MKKQRAVLSWLCAVVTLTSGCSFLQQSDSQSAGQPIQEYVSVYTGNGAFALDKEQTKTLAINKDIRGKEYIKITLESNVNLLGEYKYSDVSNPDKVVTELFYIEPSATEIEFKQFFDAFRPNAIGAFDKKLISITLKNLEVKIANKKLFIGIFGVNFACHWFWFYNYSSFKKVKVWSKHFKLRV